MQSLCVDESVVQPLLDFLAEWQDCTTRLEVQTSGSTGVPKKMRVLKEKMRNSARITCKFLGLQPGDSALLCLPLQYIAGKMMVIRALEADLTLIAVSPSGHPLAEIDRPIDFAAMIPLQVYNSLQVPAERERLQQIGTLIIGGGAIDPSLEAEIRHFPNRIYSTYGMTETLSHIALRRLNGTEASDAYIPFKSVSLSLSKEQTLIIKAPLVTEKQLRTNDVAELLPNGHFRILGRKDNIINSGGIKVQIETVEKTLDPLLPTPFAITAVPDPKFGEVVVLLHVTLPADWQKQPESLWKILPIYQRPKHCWEVPAIPMTSNGKIDRVACRRLARKLLKEATPESKHLP